MQGIARKSVAAGHASLLERGILSKSMVGSFFKCGISFGLSQGMITGKREFTPPGYAASLGSTMQDLLEVWGQRTLDGRRLSLQEAEDRLRDSYKKRMAAVPESDPVKRDAPHMDDKIKKLLELYETWLANYEVIKGSVGEVEYVERQYGFDGRTKIAGMPIAGTTDVEFKLAVYDNKTVGQKSKYRKKQIRTPDELLFYSRLTGKAAAGYLVFVHDLKKSSPVEQVPYMPTAYEYAVLGEKMARMHDSIKAGIFLPPADVAPGKNMFPCSPKWCGYFGRQCPVTKHLKRSDYE